MHEFFPRNTPPDFRVSACKTGAIPGNGSFVWYLILICTYLYITVFFWLLLYFYCTVLGVYMQMLEFFINPVEKIVKYGFGGTGTIVLNG
jgi:hypothetical protein